MQPHREGVGRNGLGAGQRVGRETPKLLAHTKKPRFKIQNMGMCDNLSKFEVLSSVVYNAVKFEVYITVCDTLPWQRNKQRR